MTSKEISRELIALAESDLSTRQRLLEEHKLSGGYDPEMEEVHISNTLRLNEIILQYGYPDISKVGKKASDAAWLIVQHSISHPDFMKDCYRLMKDNVNVSPQNIAYLYDRIQYFEGKPQRYGTQLNHDGSIYQVENKEKLNLLRAETNLPEISTDQLLKIKEPDPLSDYHQHDVDFTNWRRQKGWI